jgi:hypothetical protein
MSIVARVIRQFEARGERVTLQKIMALPDTPTIGTRLDLRHVGVRMPAEVVEVTMRREGDDPAAITPEVDVFLAYEPLAASGPAREARWRDFEQG